MLITHHHQVHDATSLLQMGIADIDGLFGSVFNMEKGSDPVLVKYPIPMLVLHHDFIIQLYIQFRMDGMYEGCPIP